MNRGPAGPLEGAGAGKLRAPRGRPRPGRSPTLIGGPRAGRRRPRSLRHWLSGGPRSPGPWRERARPRGEVEDLLRGAVDAHGHQRRQVEPPLYGRGLVEAHPRARMPRNEEGAAVGVGLDRDLESADRPGLPGDLELAHAEGRRQDGPLRRRAEAGELVEGLGGNRAQAAPRAKPEAAATPAEPLAMRTIRRR